MERLYLVLPADLQDWAREEGIPQPPQASSAALADGAEEAASWNQSALDETRRSSGLVQDESPLTVTSPDPGARYRIRPSLPNGAQRIEVAARTAQGVTLVSVTLSVDGEPLATVSAPPYRAWWQLETGQHRFTATGRYADGRQISSDAVVIEVSE
jgi:hypothetical protein